MIKNILDFKWDDKNPPLNQVDLLRINKIPFNLPNSFLNLLKLNNGGGASYFYQYYDVCFKRYFTDGLGFIYGISDHNDQIYDIVTEYYTPPEFFPKNLVAFSDTGSGNLVCFDYRNNPKTNDPPIVYWDHEADVGKDVSFIANNFDDFLGILKETETG